MTARTSGVLAKIWSAISCCMEQICLKAEKGCLQDM